MARPRGREIRRNVPCTRCGVMVKVGLSSKKDPLCTDCRVFIATTAMRQMQAKNGEYYDRWKAGMLRHAEQLASGDGGGTAGNHDS